MKYGGAKFLELDYAELLGSNIRELRLQRGLSQLQLGDAAGLHRMSVGAAERMQANLSLTNFVNIAKALNAHPAVMWLTTNPRSKNGKLRMLRYREEDYGVVLADNLKTLRTDKGLSQATVAEDSGLSQQYISHVELGEESISLANIVNVSRSVGCLPSRVVSNPIPDVRGAKRGSR